MNCVITEILQTSHSQAWEKAVKPLEGSTFSQDERYLALRFTNRCTPRRFQEQWSICFLGEKQVTSTLSTFPYSFLLPFRSETHWLVSENEKAALFKAPVGLDPIQPLSTGWKFSKEVIFGEGTDSDTNS